MAEALQQNSTRNCAPASFLDFLHFLTSLLSFFPSFYTAPVLTPFHPVPFPHPCAVAEEFISIHQADAKLTASLSSLFSLIVFAPHLSIFPLSQSPFHPTPSSLYSFCWVCMQCNLLAPNYSDIAASRTVVDVLSIFLLKMRHLLASFSVN